MWFGASLLGASERIGRASTGASPVGCAHYTKRRQPSPGVVGCYNERVKVRELHGWDVSREEAREIQRRLASEVVRVPLLQGAPGLVTGVDLSPPDPDGRARGAVVVTRLPVIEVVEVRTAEAVPKMPYIPGLLSFRESPPILAAVEKLSTAPDAFLVDGHGLAHPRRFGIACHLGLLLGTPTIGCAKNILRGRYEGLPPEEGAWAPLIDKGETIGAAVRVKAGVSPIFVSIGHMVDLETAVRWVLACRGRIRLPTPIALAHRAAAGKLAEMAPGTPATDEHTGAGKAGNRLR